VPHGRERKRDAGSIAVGSKGLGRTNTDGSMPRVPVTIRPARTDDAPTLAEAQRTIAATPGFLASQPSELTDELFAKKITAKAQPGNGCFLVAESDGELVGHGMLDPLPLAATRHVVHLTLVAHPEWQGKGIGEALLRSLIEWAKHEPTVEKIELHVRASNEAAQALYRKVGFTEMGRWRRRIKTGPGQYLDDVAMELFVK
jgi:ribosomal protein S18 acetylase RimI-like enzyme